MKVEGDARIGGNDISSLSYFSVCILQFYILQNSQEKLRTRKFESHRCILLKYLQEM
jgi:hypothetical protein